MLVKYIHFKIIQTNSYFQSTLNNSLDLPYLFILS